MLNTLYKCSVIKFFIASTLPFFNEKIANLCLKVVGQTDIIFLDFSKAFDKISHKFLLSKLHYYGIKNHTLSWIGAFLSNRTQTTVVNGVHSSYVEVTSGVPH